MKFVEQERSMIVLLLLLVSTASGTSASGDTRDWRQNITSRLCPYTDMCLTKASQEFTHPTDYEPCCSDCNCNADCIETNSCCPDSTVASDIPSERVCKSTMVKKRDREREFYDGFVDGINSYFIINRCPAVELDINVKDKCLGIDKTKLDEYIWVSDTISGKIFQNHHCAKCHGIKDWTSWNIRTQCSRIYDTSFVNITATLYSDDCNIITEAPDELAAKTNNDRCYTPTITVCNQTGLWSSYDVYVDEECKRNTAPYFQTDGLDMNIYKNIFCFVCNTGDISSAQMVCPARFSNDSARFQDNSFIALIDYRGRQGGQDTGSMCAVDQVHDTYMGKCRKLICPFGSGPSAGQCKPLTVTMDNLGVRILLDLSIDWQQTDDPNRDKIDTLSFEDNEDISKSIFKALKIKPCRTCTTFLYKYNKTDMLLRQPDLTLDLGLNTNPDCQYEWLHRNIDNAIGKVVKVSMKDHGHISVIIQYAERPLRLSSMLYRKQTAFCMAFVEPSEKYCPRIRLLFSEVQFLHNEKAKRILVLLFDGMHMNETTEKSICVSEYFKIMSQTNGGVGMQTCWEVFLLSLPLLQILMSFKI